MVPHSWILDCLKIVGVDEKMASMLEGSMECIVFIVYDPQNNPFPEKIEIRDFKGFKQSQFRSELSQVNWKTIFNSHEVNESLSRFSHLFNKISY